MISFSENLSSHAATAFEPIDASVLSQSEKIEIYKNFLKIEEQIIFDHHRSGISGITVAQQRSLLIDTVLQSIYRSIESSPLADAWSKCALVATGGYGRNLLCPKSDIDLLFLTPRPSNKLPTSTQTLVQDVLYLLWDMGFKVGHSCRSVSECIEEAKADQQNKTALMSARLIAGNSQLFQKLLSQFHKNCVARNQNSFFKQRLADTRSRHEKYSRTVFLQEPNVKESCGSMRDYHNIQWLCLVKYGSLDLSVLVSHKVITPSTLLEIEQAYDFLFRVRNELHYHNQKATDQLTLFLQGVVATALNYPQRNILRSTEAFMRDYYRHTRHIYRHANSIMEAFQIEEDSRAENSIRSFLTFRKKNREEFDGFIARNHLLFPSNPHIFEDDSNRLMRLFQHCQVRNLKPSPDLRRLIANHWSDIDRPFRYAKNNREVFQAILERKGEVARPLRIMHRIGFLGRYLPEFGALDCLVQHEFFHRYTADEHTLRCIDQLDLLVHDDSPHRAIYRRLFHEIQDPYALYLAIILHDTGRAENVREHIDGSAMLASRLCNRLQIHGARRSLIMFLVDNHLTFWRTATTKNLDDPEVIAEFASIIKTPSNLDALFLFTYVDSNGTSPDAWNSWKESLMLQLHAATHRFLLNGRELYQSQLDADRNALCSQVTDLMPPDYHQEVSDHFQRMPISAFHYRQANHIVTQVRTVKHFLHSEAASQSASAYCVKWIDFIDKGYSELILSSRDKPLLLEKICCALAACQINILSADLFTRTDGIVVNIFRVCSTNFEAISTVSIRKRLIDTFEDILNAPKLEPEKYLKRRINFLKPRNDQSIPVPVRAYVSNSLHPSCTTVEIQALDRIGLLHDLFHTINHHQLNTAHARICTEKGVAMDTLYITTQQGAKITDPSLLSQIQAEFSALIQKSETPDR